MRLPLYIPQNGKKEGRKEGRKEGGEEEGKEGKTPSSNEDVEQLEFKHIAGGNAKSRSHFENQFGNIFYGWPYTSYSTQNSYYWIFTQVK